MRICVIGNSHVAALKLAWDRWRSALHPMELTFFAQRGAGIMELRTEGRRLVPSSEKQRKQLEFTSGGQGVIDPAAYDAMLVYGLYHRRLPTEDAGRYSRAVREATVIDRTTGSHAYRMVRRLRDITPGPIFVGLTPLRANLSGDALSLPLLSYEEEIDLLDRTVFGPLGAKLIPQPAETIVDGRSTAREYSVGSRRLAVAGRDAAHPEDDDAHMNEAYGRVWLASFHRLLGEQDERAALSA